MTPRGRTCRRLLAEGTEEGRRSPGCRSMAFGTGDPAAYERWRERFLPLGVPVWVLPGNHDLTDAFDAHLAVTACTRR